VVHDDGLTVYDGQGNDAANAVANILRDLITLGYADESHAEIDYHSLKLINKEGTAYLYVSDLRDRNGQITVTAEADGTSAYYDIPYGFYSIDSVTVDGVPAAYEIVDARRIEFTTIPAAGQEITVTVSAWPTESNAYTFGLRDGGLEDIGGMSVAEGVYTRASGWASHSEGFATVASGPTSHAEGSSSAARGETSHAEGASNADGDFSHSEGYYVYAVGDYSHAQNYRTYAEGDSQTVIGKYNVRDTTSALIIGNGTGITARSNALTVDWDGNVSAAGGATLSDSATVTRDTSGDTGFIATRSDTGASVGTIVGAGGTNHGLYSFSDNRWIIYSNGTDIRTGAPLAKASGGTGTTYGLQWQSLGSFTGTNSLTINLSNYSEVMVAAKFNHTFSSQTTHKLVTAVVAKQLLTTTEQELWLGGGKSSGGTANSGALRAVCSITTTRVTGVKSSADSTDHTSDTTWYVYAR
jgi:hypothetical protein